MNLRHAAMLGHGAGIILAVTALATAHCAHADILPDTAKLEIEHVSHATQHFGPNPHEYGINAASVVLRWQLSSRFTLDLAEGMILSDCRVRYDEHICGSFYGPREVFSARLGYTFWSKR